MPFLLLFLLLFVVYKVSEEVDPTSNEDDVDLDLEEDITGTGEMKVTSETLATENDFADEVVNKTHLSTASYVDYQDTNSVSIDKQTHEVTDGEPDKASSKTEQSQTCSDSQVVDVCAQMAKSIPGKAQPAVVGAVSPEVPVVDKKPEDSKYDPLNIVKTLSELARNPGLEASSVSVVDSRTRDMKPRDLQQSKKRDNKSVSTCLCVWIGFIELNLYVSAEYNYAALVSACLHCYLLSEWNS